MLAGECSAGSNASGILRDFSRAKCQAGGRGFARVMRMVMVWHQDAVANIGGGGGLYGHRNRFRGLRFSRDFTLSDFAVATSSAETEFTLSVRSLRIGGCLSPSRRRDFHVSWFSLVPSQSKISQRIANRTYERRNAPGECRRVLASISRIFLVRKF